MRAGTMAERKRSRSRGGISPVPLGRVLATGGAAAASPFLGCALPAGAGLGAGFFVAGAGGFAILQPLSTDSPQRLQARTLRSSARTLLAWRLSLLQPPA